MRNPPTVALGLHKATRQGWHRGTGSNIAAMTRKDPDFKDLPPSMWGTEGFLYYQFGLSLRQLRPLRAIMIVILALAAVGFVVYLNRR